MQKPSIFEYMDINHYLQNFYNFRKSLDKKFSYTAWSEELGFLNKTLLRFMVQGKRSISNNSIEKLSFNLSLNLLEKRYFETLIKYKNSKTINDKNIYSKELIKIQRLAFSQTEIKAENMAVSPNLIPVIMTMLTFNDQKFNVTDIAQIFNLKNADSLIDYMKTQNLITISENNEITTNTANFKITDTFNSEELKKYYLHWIDQSKEAIQLNKEVRRFRSLIVPLSGEQFNDFVDQINDFAMLLLTKYYSNELSGKNLYMFNTALFPAISPITASYSNQKSFEKTI